MYLVFMYLGRSYRRSPRLTISIAQIDCALKGSTVIHTSSIEDFEVPEGVIIPHNIDTNL